jgi:hypothetical protein
MPPKTSSQPVSDQETINSPFTLLQNLLGTTALITASLFFMSWVYNRRYFEAFSLHGYSIRYTPQDYILNAKSALALNLFFLIILFVILIHPVSANPKFPRLVSLLNGISAVLALIYLIFDVWKSFLTWGVDNLVYKPSWPIIVSVIALLIYGILAPTFLFNKAKMSKYYAKVARLTAWSGLFSFGLVFMALTTNFIGSAEGNLDSSTNSRLLFINVATKEPLGFGIQPDLVMTDNEQGGYIYIYKNLRYLTYDEGVLYLLKPEQGVVRPLVHMIPLEKAYIVSLGPNIKMDDPVFAFPVQVTATPSQP